MGARIKIHIEILEMKTLSEIFKKPHWIGLMADQTLQKKRSAHLITLKEKLSKRKYREEKKTEKTMNGEP